MSTALLSQAVDAPAAARVKRIAYAATLAVFAASWIKPLWPVEQALHSSLTIVALIGLWLHDRRWSMRARDFVAICGFICAHAIASRWLYSNVPYDAWSRAVIGWSPEQAFALQRNPVDRVIHFLYGLCFAPAVREHALRRWPALTARQAFTLAVGAIMCTSLVYERFEWAVALSLSPDDAESYNGQQGDMWDAHADMVLATIGALLAFPRRKIAA